MSGQESPVGATHNEHICVIHLTAFQNLLRSILLIYKQRLVKVLTNDFPLRLIKRSFWLKLE